MRVIAFINQKDGVGKTTLSANLAHALARLGQRALLNDLLQGGLVASEQKKASHVA